MRYGQFLRAKRISDSRELTLKDIAAELGVSVSFVSDVEQGRRKPYDEEKTEKLIEFLRFSEEDIALMYDLAARENSRIPRDLDDMVPSRSATTPASRQARWCSARYRPTRPPSAFPRVSSRSTASAATCSTRFTFPTPSRRLSASSNTASTSCRTKSRN